MSQTSVPEIEQYAASQRIAIEPGTTLHLDFDEGAARTTGELVGMAPGEFLVVKLATGGEVSATRMFRGVTMVVRYVHGGTVFAFQGQSMGAVSAPAKLVFISHPKVVAEHNLRAHKRYDCRLPGQLRAGKLDCPMVVLNFSAAGCRVAYREPASGNSKFKRPAALGVDSDLSLDVMMPGVDGAVEMSGAVKNMREFDGRQELGVGFAELEETARGRLDAYLDAVER